MAAEELTIGEMARETGCKVPTIRYFEKIGLLPEPARSAGNTRLYSREHLSRLAFIMHSRELGFAQPAIRDLLTLTNQPDQSCDSVTEIVKTRLDDIERRISKLTALKAELERMIQVCGGGRVDNCRIIEALSDHSHEHCMTKEH